VISNLLCDLERKLCCTLSAQVKRWNNLPLHLHHSQLT